MPQPLRVVNSDLSLAGRIAMSVSETHHSPGIVPVGLIGLTLQPLKPRPVPLDERCRDRVDAELLRRASMRMREKVLAAERSMPPEPEPVGEHVGPVTSFDQALYLLSRGWKPGE